MMSLALLLRKSVLIGDAVDCKNLTVILLELLVYFRYCF